MISSIGAMLRLSLRRSRADWPLVLASAMICLIAATLLAAGVIFGAAVSVAGLHRALADAPVTGVNISVTTQASPAEAEAIDPAVVGQLESVLGSSGGTISRQIRSGSFALPGQPPGGVRDLAVIGYAERLAEHATVVAGAWPPETVPAGDPVPVAITEDVARSLALEVGERRSLESRTAAGFLVEIVVAGIFRPDDPADAFWLADRQVLDGVLVLEPYATHGPFFTSEHELTTRAAPGQVQFGWRAFPDVAALGVADVEGLRARATDLPGRLDAAIGDVAIVQTDLPRILASLEPSLLASRTGVLVLTIQLVALAILAALLSASLLTEHRRIDTAMLRSRGSGPQGVVLLAVIEGLLLTVPAALVAPWLAAVTLRIFNVVGPLADIGLRLVPEVTTEAYLAGAAAAAVCLVALTVPVIRAGRSLAAVPGSLARGETRGIGQRLGIDIALVAVAAVGLWQLRLYGAPLTRSVQGTLGLDPLLVATPTVALLAGAILALRIVPRAAGAIERVAARGRGLVPSLGARQLSRRPLRYTRSAALLILAMAMGVFAASYSWTWSTSQRDQAAFQTGAALRVEDDRRIPAWAVDGHLADLPGVIARLPVERESVPLPTTPRTGRIVALDASVAPSVVDLRSDLSAASLSDLMVPLAGERPIVAAVPLPGTPRQLRLSVGVEIRHLERSKVDEATGVEGFVDVAPDEIVGWQGLVPSVVVRDARGQLFRFPGPATIDPAAHELVVPLGTPGTEGESFAYPLELFAVDLSVTLPRAYRTTDATVTVRDVAAAGDDGAWQPVPLDLAGGWRTTAAFFDRAPRVVAARVRRAELTATAGDPRLPFWPGVDRFGRALSLTWAPAAVGDVAREPAPIIASEPLLEATGSGPGDDITLLIGGVARQVRVSGVVRAFPASDPADPTAIIDLATMSLLRFEANGVVERPDEWWLAADDGAVPAVIETLAQPPTDRTTVVSRAERGRSLARDPVALGVIGALSIGVVAAALFAVIGFTVSAAVSARERVGEFALLRALGLSTGQLSVWLSLENAVLCLFSLLSGTGLGLVIAWAVLPFITVTQGAATPFPPVEIDVPWTLIGILEAAGMLALGGTILALAWSLPRIGLASVLRMSED